MPLAVGSTALLMVAGGTIDVGMMVKKHSELQGLADSAALASAKQLAISNVTHSQVVSVAKAFVLQNSDVAGKLQIKVKTDLETQVAVQVSEVWQPVFAHFFSDQVTPVVANAIAKIYGTGSVCVLGLDKKSAQTIRLNNKARLTAKSCNVVSNSGDSRSLVVGGSARMTAQNIYTAGGYIGAASSFAPTPVEDARQMDDPLAGRPAPKFAGCDYIDYAISKGKVTLTPGVYCSGLKISGKADVTFKSGTYIIKDGPLAVAGKGKITGQNVGFYLTGKGAKLSFSVGSSISLTAPDDGPLAGLLFYEDRAAPSGLLHRITSDNARLLLGTVYLPKGTLLVDANKPVADQSAYTAIVVRKLRLMAGPNLVLNSNYAATDIPAPPGLSEASVSLVK
ncbi:pilus assembly protein TadG-related protein [Anderseniella sp. Alg231-50]|uniref:pilus assembly protein TadG-related protein n=1 Tax=Anderseniella sp. Alg231-50 TaxID=1922226 RepID=UPI00307C1BD4